MSSIELLARFEKKLRPIFTHTLPARSTVSFYSKGRLRFHDRLIDARPQPAAVPAGLARTLWGVEFRAPLLNAAGMFKNGEGYELSAAQGAGGYLAGTTTINPRTGNEKEGIRLPFVPYPESGAASNWLGLPNDGDAAVAARLKNLSRVPGCPVGISVMGSPDREGEEKVSGLIEGMRIFAEAGVDFIEINESCPNTEDGRPQDNALADRLGRLSSEFLQHRGNGSFTPVVVKFSNDTAPEQVPNLLDMLVRLGFDGVNFGNTSVSYDTRREKIQSAERKLFDYYTSTFGGGVSGRPLLDSALSLVSAAKQFLDAQKPDREFHVIHTGGVETAADVSRALENGASLVQWYTGYFAAFAESGHGLYVRIFDTLRRS